MRLLERTQFDTIYHEHFSYFALGTTAHLRRQHGLAVVDVEELPTHGGSLRVHVRHRGQRRRRDGARRRRARRGTGRRRVRPANLGVVRRTGRGDQAGHVEFLQTARREGKSVAGYGAPGKAVTFLAYCGIGPDLLPYTVDRNTHKHGMFMPGTRTPIAPVERLAETRPDYIWILPWNLRDEIAAQLADARDWGAQFVVAIPGSRSSDLGSPAQLRRLSDSSARTPAIASDAVAPGEGALRTWTIRRLPPRRKSSTSVPSGSIAWARTPDGPNRS